jgi:hypothetical protein
MGRLQDVGRSRSQSRDIELLPPLVTVGVTVHSLQFDNSTSLYCTERFKHALEDFDLKGVTLSPCGAIASLDEEIQNLGN